MKCWGMLARKGSVKKQSARHVAGFDQIGNMYCISLNILVVQLPKGRASVENPASNRDAEHTPRVTGAARLPEIFPKRQMSPGSAGKVADGCTLASTEERIR